MEEARQSKFALVVEYDGARYCGFQYQDGVATIQGELEKALLKLTGEQRRVFGASRTDTGVHAEGQVVSFKTTATYTADVFVNGLNFYLPEDIAIKAAAKIEDGFNVRRKAVSREYRYTILNDRTRSPLSRELAYQVGPELDVKDMNTACKGLCGTHDFVSFMTGSHDGCTVRTVHSASVEKKGRMVVFRVVANSFLPHQVRNTVGSLISVGLRKFKPDYIEALLNERRAGLARPTVPAHGLVLVKVNYAEPLGAI